MISYVKTILYSQHQRKAIESFIWRIRYFLMHSLKGSCISIWSCFSHGLSVALGQTWQRWQVRGEIMHPVNKSPYLLFISVSKFLRYGSMSSKFWSLGGDAVVSTSPMFHLHLLRLPSELIWNCRRKSTWVMLKYESSQNLTRVAVFGVIITHKFTFHHISKNQVYQFQYFVNSRCSSDPDQSWQFKRSMGHIANLFSCMHIKIRTRRN